MLSTPLNAFQGNSYNYPAPAITITAAHRESLAKPNHTTILRKSSQTMFSAQPAKRPGRPGFRWFKQPGSPKRPDAQQAVAEATSPTPRVAYKPLFTAPQMVPPGQQQPVYPPPQAYMVHNPHPVLPPGNQPSMQESSQLHRVQPNGQSGTGDSESFDKWMAQFCIEPDTDTEGCCLAFWAPHAQYGKTHWRLKQVEDGQDPSDVSWKPSYGCNGPCWAWFGMCVFHCDCRFQHLLHKTSKYTEYLINVPW